MFDIIPNLFATYPVTSPPSPDSTPSLGEKVSGNGESDPFERALEKAMEKTSKPSRSKEDEDPQAIYGVASVTPPVDYPVEPPQAPAEESSSPIETTATSQTASSASAADTTPVPLPSTASDSASTQTAAAAGDVLAAQITAAETSTIQTGPAQATASTGVTVSDDVILTEAQTVEPTAAAPDAVTTTPTTDTSASAEPVTADPQEPLKGPATTTSTNVDALPQETEETVPVQVTIRQAGTGMKQGYTLEGEMQSETGAESDADALTPQGVAAGWGTDGTPGNSRVQFSESARLAEARATGVVQQISDQIEALAKAPKATVHLQLQPEELGRIDLRLTTTANGVRVSMTTDQPLTREILESNLGNLRDALASAGVSLNSLNISQDNQTGQGNYAWETAKNYGQTMKAAASAAEEESEASTVAVKTSMIDYRV